MRAKLKNHHGDGGQGGGWIPFGYCSLLGCAHLPAAFLQRSISAALLDLSLHVVNGVRALHLQGDGLSRQSLHKDLHPSMQS
ncbi:hypothetical protein OIU79_021250, partial [Salix purpurea]